MKADGFQVVPLVYTPGHKRAGGKKKRRRRTEAKRKWSAQDGARSFNHVMIWKTCLFLFLSSSFSNHRFSFSFSPLMTFPSSSPLFSSSFGNHQEDRNSISLPSSCWFRSLLPVKFSDSFSSFPQFLSAFHQWKANQSFPYGYRLDPTFMKETDSPAHSWQSWNWQLGASLLSFDTGKDPDQHADELSDYETKDWWGTEPQVSPASTDDNFHLSETRRQIGQWQPISGGRARHIHK